MATIFAILVALINPLGLAWDQKQTNLPQIEEVNRLLERKYGPVRSMASTRDPLLDDMIYYRECYALQGGLQEHEATWHWKDFVIKSVVFGDEDNIWIEIEYTKKRLVKDLNEQEIQKIIKRL